MAKRKQLQSQHLSPDNYIKKRGRSLPIHECIINEDWQTLNMLNVLISRKHSNGNITTCFYLVDKMCLGVKDSYYKFNIPEYEYDELKQMFFEQEVSFTTIEYKYVHNIILAAVEFAEDYGFLPYKEYRTTTQYFLEKDDDNIELIEVPCGDNDKPVYIRGEMESDIDVARIITTLERNAGEGNYIVINESLDFLDTINDNAGELMSSVDKLKYIYDNASNIENSNHKQLDFFIGTLDALEDEMSDDDHIEELYIEYIDRYESLKPDEKGIVRYIGSDNASIADIMDNLVNRFHSEEDTDNQITNNICEIVPDTPLADYIKLKLLSLEEKENKLQEYRNELDRCLVIYPNLPVFKIEKLLADVELEETRNLTFAEVFKSVFGRRRKVWALESTLFLMFWKLKLIMYPSIDELSAFKDFLKEIDASSEHTDYLIMNSKVDYFVKYYEEHYLK